MPGTYLLTLQGVGIRTEEHDPAVFFDGFCNCDFVVAYLYRDYLFRWMTSFTKAQGRIGFSKNT